MATTCGKLKALHSLKFGDFNDAADVCQIIAQPTASDTVLFHPNFYTKRFWGRRFLKRLPTKSPPMLLNENVGCPAPYLTPFAYPQQVIPVSNPNPSAQVLYYPIAMPMQQPATILVDPNLNTTNPPLGLMAYGPAITTNHNHSYVESMHPQMFIGSVVPNGEIQQQHIPVDSNLNNNYGNISVIEADCNGVLSANVTHSPGIPNEELNGGNENDVQEDQFLKDEMSSEHGNGLGPSISYELNGASKSADTETEALNENPGSATDEYRSGLQLVHDKPAKPALWSQLFSASAAKGAALTSSQTIDTFKAETLEMNRDDLIAHDQFTYLIDEKLKKIKLSALPKRLHLNPRGLNNFGNRCFMHSALQVLVNLPQFYHLLMSIPERPPRDVPISTTPILDALKELANQFTVYRNDSNKNMSKSKGAKVSAEFTIESPFTVQALVKSLMSHKMFAQGQQEDVEEFLFFILDSLHEEFSALQNVYRPTAGGKTTSNGVSGTGSDTTGDLDGNGEADGGEWLSMGPKKKEQVSRRVGEESESIVTEMFGGQLASEVRKKGEKPVCTLERFFTLRLEIASAQVTSVNDALLASLSKESIQQADQHFITQISYLVKLPQVLILQMKLFVYNSTENRVEKVNKAVALQEDLNIPSACFQQMRSYVNPDGSNSRNYKLFAVIYHHGDDANKGHYSTSIFHTGQRCWLEFDDAKVRHIEVKSVLNCDITQKVPYLVLYRKQTSSTD